jgi:hypothetical protein
MGDVSSTKIFPMGRWGGCWRHHLRLAFVCYFFLVLLLFFLFLVFSDMISSE